LASFVHICDSRDAAAIRREGLRLSKNRYRRFERESYKFGVFAMPVIEDYLATHQWTRELMRRGHRSAAGVYFRVSDDDPVWIGRFGKPKTLVTAAEAVAALRASRELGFEAILPQAVEPGQIMSVRPVAPVGWRYFPEAKGAPPRCLCRFCTRGEANSQKMRRRLDPEGRFA
jgi:hypothetical protein